MSYIAEAWRKLSEADTSTAWGFCYYNVYIFPSRKAWILLFLKLM